MPILGVIASSISGHLTPADTGSLFPISSVIVPSGGTSTITFSSIPATYTHLQIRAYCKTARTTYSISELKMTFNGDTGNNYAIHYLTGTGSTTTVYGSNAVNQARIQLIGFGTSLNNQFGAAIVDIPDYASTSKYKTVRSLSGVMTDVAGGGSYYGNAGITSGLWNSTAAITSISFTPEDPVNFSQYTNFTLYGIKGA